MKRRFLSIVLFVIFSLSFDSARAISCTITKTGREGECKHIQSCAEVLQAYRDRKESPQVCDARLRTICCPFPVLLTTPKPPLNERISARKCREYGQLRYQRQIVQSTVIGEPPIIKLIPQCFHEVVPLIVGGEEAKIREFPHMALIGFGEGNDEDYQCGGSLISEQWILSAAHCIRARVGFANFAKLGHVIRYQSTLNSYTYSIVDRIKHPNYNSKFGDDDIALFKLEKPAILNSFVIPICLPSADAFATKSAIAIGYGKTDSYSGPSETLMKVVIEYFDPLVCNELFEYSNKFANNIFDRNKMVCAGSTNKTGDACQGDSGGPLLTYHSDVFCMYQITGVTSFGFAYCGQPGVPAVYSKVYNYLDWIEQTVWPGQ